MVAEGNYQQAGRYQRHQTLLKEAILYVQTRVPEIRFFQRHVGLFYRANGTPIKINRPGMSDLYALLPTPFGLIHIEIEVKSGTGRLSKEQKGWQKFITNRNGHFLICKDKEHLCREIKKIRDDLCRGASLDTKGNCNEGT